MTTVIQRRLFCGDSFSEVGVSCTIFKVGAQHDVATGDYVLVGANVVASWGTDYDLCSPGAGAQTKGMRAIEQKSDTA